VRVLFDQGTPVPLRHAIVKHTISTAYELGWSTLKNGELLQAAEEAGFEVLVTTDTNLKYQQNLASRKISVVVLSSTSWPRIKAVSEKVITAIEMSTVGSYIEVVIPHLPLS
jgi:glutamate racemase